MKRHRLPDRRNSWTQQLKVGSQTTYLTFGEYEDGTLGEVFIVAQKRGSLVRALLDAFAIQFSIGLQHGVPLRTAVAAMRGIDFLPSGKTSGVEDYGISEAVSILDALAQLIDATYLKGMT